MDDVLQELVDYLHRNVPMSRQMGIRAGTLTRGGVSLCAPLKTNLNDKQTMFAGTQASLCTLTGWTAVSVICRQAGLNCDIAATEGHIEYLKPVDMPLACAQAALPGRGESDEFLSALRKAGRASIRVKVLIRRGADRVVVFAGRYFARLGSAPGDDRRGV